LTGYLWFSKLLTYVHSDIFFSVHFRGEEGASGDGGQEPTLICKKNICKICRMFGWWSLTHKLENWKRMWKVQETVVVSVPWELGCHCVAP